MDGWIILDKASGLFSRTAGGKLSRMFGAKTSGHIGTLDPMATGVLPVALGAATKMIPFIDEGETCEKEYLFSLQFGFETDTLDITGSTVAKNDIVPTVAQVLAVLPELTGDIMQIPPVYSALHINGQRAYDLARRGAVVDMPARAATVFSLEFTGITGNSWGFKTRCASGTYVRSLGRDIAKKCGAIATVDMIRRTKTGRFDIKDAVKLDFLENLVNNDADISKYLKSTDFVLGDIPVINLNNKDAVLYKNGGFIKMDATNGLRRIYSDNVFIGVGVITDGELRPKRTI